MHEPIRLNTNDFEKGGIIKLDDIFDKKFYSYEGQFLYPPRIESKIPPRSISKFDNGNFIAQPKLNGSNTSVTISKNNAIAKERHNKFFAVPPKFDFKSLHRGNGYMCITGEFMNKSKKDQNGIAFKGFCIWDIVAYDGKLLLGSTLEQRIELLEKLFPSKGEVTHKGITYLLKTDTPDVYRVNNFYGKFEKLYDTLSQIDMVEGLVLKRKYGELENLTKEQNNVGWSIKVRKPTKNYRY